MAVDVRREAVIPPASSEVNVYSATMMRARRISWGAIVAGVVIALVTSIALQMLGLSIGAATVNPVSEIDPVEPALGTGAVIWYAASSLISLFLGGFVASHMAGIADETDGVLHGLVTWAVVALLTLWMLSSGVGSILSGITSAASSAISQAGQVVADVSPEVADALNVQDGALASIQNDLRVLVQEANTPAVSSTDEDGIATAQQPQASADQPMTLDEFELNRGVRNFLMLDNIGDADRSDLVTLLTERTNLTEQEAQATVQRWEETFVQIRTEAEDTARQVGQAAADAVTLLAGAVFVALLIGAFAAGVGGAVGTPEPEDYVPDAA